MNNNQQQGNRTNNQQQGNSGGVKFGKGFKQAGGVQANNTNYQRTAGYQKPQTNMYGQGANYNTQQPSNAGNNYSNHRGNTYSSTVSNTAGLQNEKDTRNMWELFLQFWRKYVDFKGCATRREYWLTILMIEIINIILLIIYKLSYVFFTPLFYVIDIILFIFWLAMFVPGLALVTRRLHDTGRSGHWQWLELTGFGSIAVLVFLCQKSKYENNKYRN